MEIVPLRTSALVLPARYIRLFLLSLAGIASAGCVLSLAEPSLAFWIIAASVGGVLIFASAGFQPFSFVFIVGLTHLIFYPLAGFLNLLLESPAVRPDLWDSVEQAMAGGAVGCFALAFGSWLSRYVPEGKTDLPDFVIPRTIILLAIAIQSVAAVLLLSLGLYFHSSVRADYAFQNVQYVNAVVFASWVGHAALFLQVYRYYRTGKIIDVFLATGGVIFAIALFAPSGSRTQAFQFVPLLAFLFLALEKRSIVKYTILGIMIIIGLFLVVGIGIYRDLVGLGILSEQEGIAPIVVSIHLGMDTLEDAAALTVHRLSDFAATGRIIDYTPDRIPYRGFGDIIDWWQMFLPGAIRPDIDLAMDGARETVKYGVSFSMDHSSSPVMIIGDLFGRGGWVALFVGMTMIGFVLGIIDRQILFRVNPFTVVFFALFGRHILSIVSSSTLNVFVVLTRELILMYAISYVLIKVVALLVGGNFRWEKAFK